MLELKKKLLWLINNFEQVLCSLFLLTLVVLLFTQVVSRYVFSVSIPWTEELSRYVFLWMVFMGVSLGAKEGQHIRIIDHFKKLPKKVTIGIILFADLIWLTFNFIVVIEGFKLFVNMGQYGLFSAVLDWDLKYIFLVIPISFLLASIRILQNHYVQFKAFKNESSEQGGFQ